MLVWAAFTTAKIGKRNGELSVFQTVETYRPVMIYLC